MKHLDIITITPDILVKEALDSYFIKFVLPESKTIFNKNEIEICIIPDHSIEKSLNLLITKMMNLLFNGDYSVIARPHSYKLAEYLIIKEVEMYDVKTTSFFREVLNAHTNC